MQCQIVKTAMKKVQMIKGQKVSRYSIFKVVIFFFKVVIVDQRQGTSGEGMFKAESSKYKSWRQSICGVPDKQQEESCGFCKISGRKHGENNYGHLTLQDLEGNNKGPGSYSDIYTHIHILIYLDIILIWVITYGFEQWTDQI